jgi:cytochrome c peroxidase
VAVNAAHAAQAPDSGYEWHLPAGFPRPAVPLDNPMSAGKAALGRRLFFDTRLSSTGNYACASCHRPALAFTDGRARAQGATGEAVRRGAMTLTNVAYNIAFTWGSGSVRSLEAQMRQPLFSAHPVEMGLQRDGASVTRVLSADDGYRAQFQSAFPGEPHPVSMDHIIKAIACFERTLISGRAPFDRYTFDDDRTAMSESAVRGMALFYSSRAGCSACHSGINFSGPMKYAGHTNETPLFANTGLYNLDRRGAYPHSDQGLIETTHRAQDMGKFRVPTLRNVALTGPYMHDGSLPTLNAVLDHYVRGGRKNPHQDARIRPLSLSESERSELLAFLDSLTDRDFVENPEFSSPNEDLGR